jgi:hypothetical protein
MNPVWKCEEGLLRCNWSGAGEGTPFKPRWMPEVGCVKPKVAVAPTFLEFTRLSLLAGRRWFDPNRRLDLAA